MTDFEKMEELWQREDMINETYENIHFFMNWANWRLPQETMLQHIKDIYIQTINDAIEKYKIEEGNE